MRDGHARGLPSFARFARFDAPAWCASSGLPVRSTSRAPRAVLTSRCRPV